MKSFSFNGVRLFSDYPRETAVESAIQHTFDLHKHDSKVGIKEKGNEAEGTRSDFCFLSG